MAAAEVDPVHALEEMAELLLDRRQRAFQGPEALLAQCVEVEPGDAVEIGALKRGPGGAQPRARRAGVVDFGRALAVLRIEAHAEPQMRPFRLGAERLIAEPVPLACGIEDHMVRQREHLGEVLARIGRRKAMHLAAVILTAKPGLPRSAGRGATEVPHDLGRRREHGECLERQQDARAAFRLHPAEQRQVPLQRHLVDHEARARHAREVELFEGRCHAWAVRSRFRVWATGPNCRSPPSRCRAWAFPPGTGRDRAPRH